MPSKCFVNGCTTGHGFTENEPKLYSFRPPTNSFKLWKRNIPKSDMELSLFHYVCELHFQESCLVRHWAVKIGGKICTVRRVRPKLKPGAVPTIFPRCPFPAFSEKGSELQWPAKELELLAKVLEVETAKLREKKLPKQEPNIPASSHFDPNNPKSQEILETDLSNMSGSCTGQNQQLNIPAVSSNFGLEDPEIQETKFSASAEFASLATNSSPTSHLTLELSTGDVQENLVEASSSSATVDAVECLGNDESDECSWPTRCEADSDFRWSEYLEKTGCAAAPSHLFPHVLVNETAGRMEKGMVVEIQRESENQKFFWLATVKLVCGPISKVVYIGGEDLGAAGEIWGDISKLNIFPLKTASFAEYYPPDVIRDSCSDWRDLLNQVLESDVTTLSNPILKGSMQLDLEDIAGRIFLVRDEADPFKAWFAEVKSAHGGLLKLFYLLPGKHTLPSFVLFHSSERLLDYSCISYDDDLLSIPRAGIQWTIGPPKHLQISGMDCEISEIEARAKEQISSSRKLAFPFYQPNAHQLPKHKMNYGLFVESVHPLDSTKLCACQVTEVIDDYYFKIAMLEVDVGGKIMGIDRSTDRWHCANSPLVFHAGWAKIQNLRIFARCRVTGKVMPFDWPVGSMQLSTKEDFVVDFSKLENDFQTGMKLEFIHKGEVAVSSVAMASEHILLVHVDCEPRSVKYFVHRGSTHIFPAGWAEHNGLSVIGPGEEQPEGLDMPTLEEEHAIASTPQMDSMWCPVIYFNHKCFSGNLLVNKRFLAIPRSVGPGPISLVLREVITLLMNASSMPKWFMKELRAEKAPVGMQLEGFKAKAKTGSTHGTIPIASSAAGIPAFCKYVLKRLKCCPNLVGLTQLGDSCPDNCENMKKAYWLHRKYTSIGKSYQKRYERLKNDLLHESESEKLLEFFTLIEGVREKGKSEMPIKKTDEDPEKRVRVNPRKPLFVSEITTRKKRIDVKELGESPRKRKHSDGERKKTRELGNKKSSPTKKAKRRSIGPPIEPLDLTDNPLFWTSTKVAEFLRLNSFEEQAEQFAHQEIDGHAFLLLNLPTLLQHTNLSLDECVLMCHLVERVLLTFYEKFFHQEPPESSESGDESAEVIENHSDDDCSDELMKVMEGDKAVV